MIPEGQIFVTCPRCRQTGYWEGNTCDWCHGYGRLEKRTRDQMLHAQKMRRLGPPTLEKGRSYARRSRRGNAGADAGLHDAASAAPEHDQRDLGRVDEDPFVGEVERAEALKTDRLYWYPCNPPGA